MKVTTLTKRADFLRLNRGHKVMADTFILRSMKNGSDACRVGYTVTTKCGNAVVRNRIKRRLRAMVRELKEQMQAGMDYVFIARADAKPNAGDAPIDALRGQMQQALSRVNG